MARFGLHLATLDLSRKPDPLLQEREGSGELHIQAKGGGTGGLGGL